MDCQCHCLLSTDYVIVQIVDYYCSTEILKNNNVNMSCVVRKPAFCICENKDADQLCGNRQADQRLCFCYTDSTIPLLPKSEIFKPLTIFYSLLCFGPGQKLRRQVFLQRGSYFVTSVGSRVKHRSYNFYLFNLNLSICLTTI